MTGVDDTLLPVTFLPLCGRGIMIGVVGAARDGCCRVFYSPGGVVRGYLVHDPAKGAAPWWEGPPLAAIPKHFQPEF